MQGATIMGSKRDASSGGLGFLDVIVLLAMAVTATAVAAGLIVQSGIATVPSVIAAAALYMVVAASYLTLARATRPGTPESRLNDFEDALEIIDADLQRIDKVEDEVGRLDALTDRVERLDGAVREYHAAHLGAGLPRPEQFQAEFEDVNSRIETLRADLEGETRNQREKISTDLRQLEGLIVRLSGELTTRSAALDADPPAPTRAMFEPEPVATIYDAPSESYEDVVEAIKEIEEIEEIEEEDILAVEDAPPERVAGDTAGLDASEDASLDTSEDAPLDTEEAATLETYEAAVLESYEAARREPEEPAPAPAAEDEIVGFLRPETPADPMVATLREAIETGRIDLYLQPVITLPERKLRYYEAYTRVRPGEDEEALLPGAYLAAAEGAGMMPLIDNVLLVKSVQVLRRLGPNSKTKGIFCNISTMSLLDPDFFPELVEFMEENSGLSESLIFEIGQPAMQALARSELAALDTLGALGYGFSLDHVGDLRIDFAELRERHFRFIKVDAPTFLNDMEAKGAVLPVEEMKAYIADFDLELIVEKVEEEAAVATLLDHGIELAQGHLFGEPKAMSPALVRELEDANAA